MLKTLPTTLLFMLVVFIVAIVATALVLAYGWLFTLITPLDLWQTMVLTTIALVALMMGMSAMALLPFGNIISYLLFGTPIATATGILLGWLLTLITFFDAWRAMLLGTILVGSIAYFLLRLSGDFLETIAELEEVENEDDDDEGDEHLFIKEVDRDLFEDVVWIDKQGRATRRPRKRRKGKKS